MNSSSREHREVEFAELEGKANEFLFKPQLVCQPQLADISMPRFITWHFPAFGNYRSWSVCLLRKRRGELSEQLAREVTWKRTSDARRFTEPLIGLAEGFRKWPTLEI